MKIRVLIALLMATLMILGVVGLTGCQEEPDVLDDDQSDESETEAPPPEIALVENGKAVYTVIYPATADNTVLAAKDRLLKIIEDATGVKLPSKSDYLRPGQTRDENAKEILLGKTDYTETSDALANMCADEYVMKAVGNKIVITSHNDSYLIAAMNYLSKNLIKNNLEGDEGAYTLYFEEYRFIAEGADKVLNINGKKIEDFVIVYDASRDGYKEAAEHLADSVRNFGKVTIPVYADTQRAEGGCEILVGKTNRALSAKSYSDFVDLLTYKVVVDGTQVQIVSGGPFSARSCSEDATLKMLSGGLKMTNGTYFETDMKTAAPAISSEGDARIMTSNMLAGWWERNTGGIAIGVASRAEIAAALLMLYKPDVVGLQEIDGAWATAVNDYVGILKDHYGLEYSPLHATHNGKVNLTCLLYRSDKYTVKSSGVEVSSFWTGNYHMRNITWGVFSDGTHEFMVANNHWAHESNEWRESSSNQLADFINNNSFKGPIFCTGDFNAKPQVLDTDVTGDGEKYFPAFQNFMDKTDAKWLKDEAKKNGTLINEVGGCGNIGSYRTGGNYIDHIFGVGNFTVLRYETIVKSSAQWMSDHSPHYCDVKFN